MANQIQDRVGQLLGSDTARALAGTAVTEVLKGVGGKSDSGGSSKNGAIHPPRALSGMRGVAAGAGAAALAPVAAKGIGKLIKGNGVGALADAPKKVAEAPKKAAEGAVSKVGDTVSGKISGKIDEAGGPSGILKDTVKGVLPFGGGGGGGKNDAQGVGKGRRMPIQQSVDIGLPLETVYNQWTQFDEWPKFMHRVKRASQEDPCTVSFAVKIWGRTREYTAKIETQRPDDRIKWKTTQGMNLAGVVMFRELAPNLTRVLLSFDVDPGGMVEKYARGARYVKRAARADLHRFAAFVEMLEQETGAWRGVIEDGELVKDHDPSYDKKREYGSADELLGGSDDDEEDKDKDDDEDDDKDKGRGRGRQRSGSGSRSGSSRQTRASSSGTRASSSGTRSRASSSGTRGKSAKSGGGSGSSKSARSGSSSRSSSSRSNGSSASSSGRTRSSRSQSSNGHQGRQRSQSQKTRSSGRG